MKLSELTLLAVLIFTLSGCGDGNTPTTSTEVPVVAIGIGDSTISSIWYDPIKLQNALPKGSTYITHGAPGQCAIEGQQNNLNIIYNAPKGSTIIFLSGINDARRCGTSVEMFTILVKELHDYSYAYGKKFVVITPNPTFTGAENEMLSLYAQAERNLGYNIADFRQWIEDPTIAKNFDYGTEVANDGTHPSPKIYDWLSPKLASVIVSAK